MNPRPLSSGPWYAAPRFLATAAALVIVLFTVEAYFAIVVRRNDFNYHRRSGAAFLAGEPYATGNVTYPVSRIMMNAALAVLPNRPTRAVCYLLALAALAASWRIWSRLSEPGAATPSPAALAAGLLTLGLYWAYVVRDLDECGLQLFLLFLFSAAAWCLVQGWAVLAGFFLAWAAHYKVTPILC
ncbi:MAG: hypothetical protein NZO58_04810 [Gemmataceae bacterium]|nr:hypothetical protein [Gemmataceae bacterium]